MLHNKLTVLKGPQVVETYHKGEDFKGLLFAKFATKGDRDVAVRKLRQAKEEVRDRKVWAKPDQPVEKRVPATFFFALKRTLLEWGLNKGTAWVDEDRGTLEVAGKLVVTVSVSETATGTSETAKKKLECNWAEEWKTWKELQNSSELKALLEQADETLNRGGKGKSSKGWSKGH